MKPIALLRAALLACGLLLTAACSAHNDAGAPAGPAVPATTEGTTTASATAAAATPAPAASTHFTEGQQYVSLKPPAGQAAPTGPVEVVEVFSYGCPHCAEFAPYMDKLRASLPKDVEVRYMPAVFSQAWVPYAQAFYAARELGVLNRTHDAMFQAMLEHYPLNSLQDMAAWYGRHGADPQKFIAAATSKSTMQQMADDQKTEMGWGIDATPTLVVGRRANDDKTAPFVAQMRSADIDSYAQLQQLGLWMVHRASQR
ncbi:MAG TPA: thiol:disulfide interchange protein DsbA/DsbL [Rhodanobacteraceae bacterium]|nr:thiol:disulfide interchange protein DsbA/DsbL [Rhodanobacteraceae bacterium]